MNKRISELLRQGKSVEEILSILAKEFSTETNEKILDALASEQKAFDLQSSMEKKTKEEAEKKSFSEAVEKKVAEVLPGLVDEKMKSITVPGLLDSKGGEGAQIREGKELWKKDSDEYLGLCLKKYEALEEKEKSRLSELRGKMIQRAKDTYGEKTIDAVISGTDNAGGYFMPPEFDAEVDKLIYTRSAVMDAMKIRTGGEKTEINSISTFNFSTRTDENAAFGTTKPTFAQQELKYRDAGTIVLVSNRALNGSYYNLTNELIEGASDAKIRHIEPLIFTGSVDVDSDPFDGIRFHTGVTTYNCKNNGGSGKLVNVDLTNGYLSAPSQSRNENSAMFVMDSRELQLLLDEKDNQGRPVEYVRLENGVYTHKATGKKIIAVDTLHRLLNGVTDRSTGTDVPVIFGPMDRLRFYQLAGLRIDMSRDRYFEYDATGLRFIFSYKFGIPTQSRSSFVTVQGVKYNEIA